MCASVECGLEFTLSDLDTVVRLKRVHFVEARMVVAFTKNVSTFKSKARAFASD